MGKSTKKIEKKSTKKKVKKKNLIPRDVQIVPHSFVLPFLLLLAHVSSPQAIPHF